MSKSKLMSLPGGMRRISVAPLLCVLGMLSAFVAPVFAAADLGIAIVTSNPTPTAGGAAFSYTLTVTNNGPDTALGIVVNDAMPPGVIFQNVSIVNNPSTPGFGLSCVGPPVGTNGTVTCTGSLPGVAPSVSTITIVAQIVANIASGVRTNTATVASDTQEASPNTLANTASVQQNIVVNAPVTITLGATAAAVAGDPILFQLSLMNNGSSDAINPTITHNLPSGTQFLGLYGSHALHKACSASGGGATVTCSPKSIPQGLHQLVVLAETFPGITPTGPIQSTATLSPGTGSANGSPASANTNITLNAAPTANGESYVTNMNTALVVAATGVKSNDSDDEDLLEVLTVTLVNGPLNGVLTVPLAANGSFTYTPTNGYTGPDNFTYTLTDSRGSVSSVATATIRVNAAPTASNESYLTNLNTALVVAAPGVKSNDSDDADPIATLTATLVTGPLYGTLSTPLAANGSFTYTPNNGYTGPDSFTYTLTDSTGMVSNVATASITVNAPPVAYDDNYATFAGSGIAIASTGVKANDSDDADSAAALVATLVTGPSNGTLLGGLGANGSFVYQPSPGFSGFDSFTYSVTDTNGLTSNVATVTINVRPIPPIPLSPWTTALLAGLLVAFVYYARRRGGLRQR